MGDLEKDFALEMRSRGTSVWGWASLPRYHFAPHRHPTRKTLCWVEAHG